MKHLYTRCTACLFMACLFWNQIGFAQSPTHKPVTVNINSNCGGYYEYLPQDYNAGSTERYPLIVYIHGNGDRGNGSQSDLGKLVSKALPKYIKDGLFPASVTLNGQSFRFLVISPQFKDRPWPTEIGSVITYIKNNYKVDTNRIYLTGMSMGGGVIWEFAGSDLAIAQKLAAIVPICGQSTPQSAITRVIARGNVPVWATHNQDDQAVLVSNTNDYIRMINGNAQPPTPLAVKTIFTVAPPTDNHDAWTQTYNPTWKENNKNIYQWMLQYTRAEATLPVTLTNYKITAASKEGVTIGWSTTAEQNNQYFTIERSSDGVSFQSVGQVAATNLATGSNYSFRDAQPAAGNNFYRLSQTDLNGKTTYFTILKAVITINTGSLLLFPNPATHSFTVGFNHPAKDKITVKVIDQQGMIVLVKQYHKEAGYWQQSIATGLLTAGQYFIHVKGKEIEYTQPLLIRK